MPVGRAAKLPVVLDVLSDDLEYYVFGEEAYDDNFICLAAAASTFRP